MDIEYHKWFSTSLGQDMEIKIYGSGGKPAIVFPTEGGRFFEFEDFGMVVSVQKYIDEGMFQFYTVDSIDNQSWANQEIPPDERALRHEDFDRYIVRELAPFIQEHNHNDQKLLATGCSMGGYHAANFFFRHPDMFDSVISLSGMLQLRKFVGDYMDIHVYLNSPLDYLARLDDPWYLEQYKKSKIIICVGRGEWEEPMVLDAQALQRILFDKGIPGWVDYWGEDVTHDWPWWRKQLPYYMEKLDSQ